MFKKKKLTIQDSKKIINFLNVRKDMEDDEKTTELIYYTIKLLYNKEFDEIEEEKRKDVIKEALFEANAAIGKYLKMQERKKENDYVFISIKNKEYKSNPLNIKLFYEINNKMVNGEDVFKIAEYVLLKLFNGIISYEKIEEIKENDYLYYEIIIEDVSALIYKTLSAAMKITEYKNPLKQNQFIAKNKFNELSEKIDKCLDTYNTDIYSIMLENYSILPEQVNKESAVTILELINSLKASQIKREIKEEIEKIKKNPELSNDTKLEVLEQYLIELGGE